MCIQLVSYNKLIKLVREQKDMPDLYSLASVGPYSVELVREDSCGLEAALQGFGRNCGMSSHSLGHLDQRLGWMIFAY